VTTLQRAFEALVATFHEQSIRYAIVGGIATIQYGRTRATDDVDALVTVPQITMPRLFERLSERGFEIDLRRIIKELRDEGMTSFRYHGVQIDLMKPLIPAYQHVLDRAVDLPVLTVTARISKAEGLIVMKLIAMRPQDEADVHELLRANEELDLEFVRKELDGVMDVDDPRRVKFEGWVKELRT
jgi:hypothetical protein